MDALKYGEAACLLRRDYYGYNSIESSKSLEYFVLDCHETAKTFIRMSQLDRAVLAMRIAERITESVVEPKHARSLDRTLKKQLISVEMSRLKLRGVTYNNMGTLYKRMGDLNTAMECFQEALRLIHKSQDSHGPVCTHLNLAVLYHQLRRHHTALEHADCAVELLHEEETMLKELLRNSDMSKAQKHTERRNQAIMLTSAFMHKGLEERAVGEKMLGAQSLLSATTLALEHLGMEHRLTRRCDGALVAILDGMRNEHLLDHRDQMLLQRVLREYREVSVALNLEPIIRSRPPSASASASAVSASRRSPSRSRSSNARGTTPNRSRNSRHRSSSKGPRSQHRGGTRGERSVSPAVRSYHHRGDSSRSDERGRENSALLVDRSPGRRGYYPAFERQSGGASGASGASALRDVWAREGGMEPGYSLIYPEREMATVFTDDDELTFMPREDYLRRSLTEDSSYYAATDGSMDMDEGSSPFPRGYRPESASRSRSRSRREQQQETSTAASSSTTSQARAMDAYIYAGEGGTTTPMGGDRKSVV